MLNMIICSVAAKLLQGITEGLKELGVGCFRQAFLLPGTSIVMKLGDASANSREMARWKELSKTVAGIHLAACYGIMEGRHDDSILFQEYIPGGEESLSVSDVQIMHNALYVHGITDLHIGNIRRKVDGTLVCIDYSD